MARSVLLYARTVRHLKPRQIFFRLLRRLPRRALRIAPAPPLRDSANEHTPFPLIESLQTDSGQFVFLNEAGFLERSSDWNRTDRSLLWLYHAHYFDDLKATDALVRLDGQIALIQRWIDENPVGEGIGWHPYPTSLRIVNWIKWMIRFDNIDADLCQSLATQVRWLESNLEYHLLGNHLFANAKALAFAGVFFTGGEAANWHRKGARLLERQMAEQFLADGGHFERSPMYHHLMLEDLLDIANIRRRYALPDDGHLTNTLHRARRWSLTMRHPDGGIPFFNDANFSGALTPAVLDRYAVDLGVASPREKAASLACCLCQESGFVRIAKGPAVAFMDVGAIAPDYLPGHAHAETLAIELSLYSQRVFVNQGVGEYGLSEKRLVQRGTAAHNTLRIDGIDSSEVWSGFRVGRRARICNSLTHSVHEGEIQAAHDGYRHRPGRPVHHRAVSLGHEELRVRDSVRSRRGQHCFEVFWHLSPDVCIQPTSDPEIFEIDIGVGLAILSVSSDVPVHTAVEVSHWYPRFGTQIETRCVVIRGEAKPAAICTTHLQWRTAGGG